jgi:hypothetical protein
MEPIRPTDSIYAKCQKLNAQLSIYEGLLNAGMLGQYNNDPFQFDMARSALDGEEKFYTEKCSPIEGK